MDFKNQYSAQMPQNTSTLSSPPPPYTSNNGTSTSFSNSINDTKGGGISTIPQTLHVNYANWPSHLLILDPSNNQNLFMSHGAQCSSRIEITNQQGQTIGTTKASRLTSKIDIEINDSSIGLSDQSFEIHNSASVLGGSPRYTSPSFGGEVTWENKAMSSKIIYTLISSETGMAMARFEGNRRTKIGTLEFVDGEILRDQGKLNEAAVTLLAILHRKLKMIQAAYIAAVT